MKEIIRDVTNLFQNNKELPNPDTTHNIALLQQAHAKIETGIFTRYFKKSFFIMMEVIGYTVLILCIGAGVFSCIKLSELFKIINQSVEIIGILENKNYDTTTLRLVEILVYLLSFVPALVTFFGVRSYTRARQRINLIREVESLIERVIYNLKG